jgi:cell division protease FtsH
MKFTFATIVGLLVADKALAFAPPSSSFTSRNAQQRRTSKQQLRMAVDMPPPPPESNVPMIVKNSYGEPTDVRYSDFVKLVNANRVEKVTFSADGTQLLGVDVDGARLKIEALPNDPDLLTQLTTHKV